MRGDFDKWDILPVLGMTFMVVGVVLFVILLKGGW
jgi:hypothetical protein